MGFCIKPKCKLLVYWYRYFFFVINFSKIKITKSTKFGELLGRIIAPIIMSMIFFLIVTPIGLILKMFHKDLLNLKFNKKKTYWMKKDKTIQSMDKQF